MLKVPPVDTSWLLSVDEGTFGTRRAGGQPKTVREDEDGDEEGDGSDDDDDEGLSWFKRGDKHGVTDNNCVQCCQRNLFAFFSFIIKGRCLSTRPPFFSESAEINP